MFRKPVLLAVTALAAIAASASAATAAQIDNPGMFETNGIEFHVGVHIPIMGEVELFECTDNMEANVTANGHFDFHNVAFSAPGEGACTTVNDCDDAGWEGQLTSEHSVTTDICFEGSGASGSDFGGEMTCSIGDGWAEVHCESSILRRIFGIPFRVEINGELHFDNAFQVEA